MAWLVRSFVVALFAMLALLGLGVTLIVMNPDLSSNMRAIGFYILFAGAGAFPVVFLLMTVRHFLTRGSKKPRRGAARPAGRGAAAAPARGARPRR
jgi:hypothetical protein